MSDFSGGTGTLYSTTDTTAVVRALQIDADEVWKGTKVDGIYSKDPMDSRLRSLYNILVIQRH